MQCERLFSFVSTDTSFHSVKRCLSFSLSIPFSFIEINSVCLIQSHSDGPKTWNTAQCNSIPSSHLLFVTTINIDSFMHFTHKSQCNVTQCTQSAATCLRLHTTFTTRSAMNWEQRNKNNRQYRFRFVCTQNRTNKEMTRRTYEKVVRNQNTSVFVLNKIAKCMSSSNEYL